MEAKPTNLISTPSSCVPMDHHRMPIIATTTTLIPIILLIASYLGSLEIALALAHNHAHAPPPAQMPYAPAVDAYRIRCGSEALGNSVINGLLWTDDHGFSAPDAGASFSSSLPDSRLPSGLPFLLAARVFLNPSAYDFPGLHPGRYWIRLYFYPFVFDSHPDAFDPNNAVVTVETATGPRFTLVSALNLTKEMKALGSAYVFREFSVDIEDAGSLRLIFSPGGRGGASATPSIRQFAMVNGIEVVSMPDLFPDSLGSGGGPLALATEYRVNVGGRAIAGFEDSLTRAWGRDSPYFVRDVTSLDGTFANARVSLGSAANRTADAAAPLDVYRSARYTDQSHHPAGSSMKRRNLTWIFPADLGFRYYIRFHFCELVYNQTDLRVFNVYINGQILLDRFDLVSHAEGKGKVVIKDFTFFLDEGKSIAVELGAADLLAGHYEAILNGLEIFKMNDTSGNLQGAHANYTGPLSLPLLSPSPSDPPETSVRRNLLIITASASAGTAILLLAIAYLVFFMVYFRKKSATKSFPESRHRGKLPSLASKKTSVSELCRCFTFSEVVAMTENFNEGRIIGKGGFGKVYFGVLEDGTRVAVKKGGDPGSDRGAIEFRTEIEMLSKLRHSHLVMLLGFCDENAEKILVYEYMANGCLRSHLYGSNRLRLSWEGRLEACIGVARGLHYLHTGTPQGIIHRDVKTTNILLDGSYMAKVSDFGLSKRGPMADHSHVSTAVRGSYGYFDPEYLRRQKLTQKSDVYSFGVVLLEVVCAVNPAYSRDETTMVEWAISWHRKGAMCEIMDASLAGKVRKESLLKFMDTAEKCVAWDRSDRPTMVDVLKNLEHALELQVSGMGSERASDRPTIFDVPMNLEHALQLQVSGFR